MDTQKLDKGAWIRAGLAALAKTGPEMLRADRLAREIGVSRGSFYWHFTNVASFQDAVLEAWEQQAVDQPLERSIAASTSAAETLQRLICRAFEAPLALERAMYRWAVTFPPAAQRVAKVNARRLGYLADLFDQAGTSPGRSRESARILYWAYLGRLILDDEVVNPTTLREIEIRFGIS